MSDLDFSNLLTGLVDDHATPEEAKLRDLDLTEIYEDPNNPRQVFNQAELGEMAASMKEHGLLQPITVRPKDERGYKILYGARRFRAAQLAGLEKIRAIVTTSDADEAHILAAQVIENHHRTGLTTQEMILAVARLLDGGLSQSGVGKKLGISREHVNMYAALRELPPALSELTASLGMRVLYELNGAWKRDAARTEAFIAEKGEAITVGDARAFFAELKSPKSDPAPESEPASEGVSYVRQGAQKSAEADRAGEPARVAAPAQANEHAASEPTRSLPPRRSVIVGFDVKVGRRSGLLLLDAGPDEQTVLVEYEGGEVEPAPIASVRLVGVRSH